MTVFDLIMHWSEKVRSNSGIILKNKGYGFDTNNQFVD